MLKLKVCKVYFDTEFTGLTKDTDLISIGMVVLNYKTMKWSALYHEFTDYDKSKMNDWVKELNYFLTMNRKDILKDSGKISHEEAMNHVEY